MKQMMYSVEWPFAAVAYPLQDKVTIGNLADKDQPNTVIHTKGLFMSFIRLRQYNE